jgi:hypothetical protein
MRIIAAGVVAFLIFFAVLFVLFEYFPATPGAVAIGVLVCGVALAIAVSARMLRLGKWSTLGFRDPAAVIADLEAAGHLATTSYEATRAFHVQEFGDEGPTYFLDLTDGRILCLTGQYLYDYEPISDDPEQNQPRRFPCTAFTVRWHATKRYTIDILLGGQVLEPVAKLPPFGRDIRNLPRRPTDRLVIQDDTFDDLMARGGALRTI